MYKRDRRFQVIKVSRVLPLPVQVNGVCDRMLGQEAILHPASGPEHFEYKSKSGSTNGKTTVLSFLFFPPSFLFIIFFLSSVKNYRWEEIKEKIKLKKSLCTLISEEGVIPLRLYK